MSDGVTKSHISEAIFGWGLRNDDGDNLSMDDTDEIAEYIMAQAAQAQATPPAAVPVRKDYIRRLIKGVRDMIEHDSDTIKARKELGDEVTIGRWIDAEILCNVIEEDVLSAQAQAEPECCDTPHAWTETCAEIAEQAAGERGG